MSTLRTRRFPRATHTSGFTLIEILIAVLVLSIGMLGLAATQIQSLQNSHASYERSMATMQARDLVERLWAGICVLYDADGNIVPSAQAPIMTTWQADHNGVGTFAGQGWTPVLTPPATGANVWTITIDWTGPAQGQPEQIRHLFRLPPPLRPDTCP
jgi:type IV pilus assembly protein PilV